jgi:hypothetical protein
MKANETPQGIYEKPIFTEQEVEKFEKSIDSLISKGNQQICLSTGIVSDEVARFQCYLRFHYPSGNFTNNPNVKYYRVAKKGKKYNKQENW